MKRHAPRLFVLFPMIAMTAIFTACQHTLDPEGPYRGDEILFTADTTIANSFDTLHAFVSWEYTNRAALRGVPEIHEAAQFVRANIRTWRDAAIEARDAYAAVPSESNRAALQRAVAVIRAALTTAARLQLAHANPTPTEH